MMGDPRPTPKKFVTPYVENIYKNVNKALNYNPETDSEPTFKFETYTEKMRAHLENKARRK